MISRIYICAQLYARSSEIATRSAIIGRVNTHVALFGQIAVLFCPESADCVQSHRLLALYCVILVSLYGKMPPHWAIFGQIGQNKIVLPRDLSRANCLVVVAFSPLWTLRRKNGRCAVFPYIIYFFLMMRHNSKDVSICLIGNILVRGEKG